MHACNTHLLTNMLTDLLTGMLTEKYDINLDKMHEFNPNPYSRVDEMLTDNLTDILTDKLTSTCTLT